MTSSESNIILENIEKNYEVEKLNLLGFDLWPLLKFKLYQKLSSESNFKNNKQNPTSTFLRYKIVQTLSSVIIKSLIRFRKPQLFFINFEDYLHQDENHIVNKYFFSLKKHLTLKYQDFYYYNSFKKVDYNNSLYGIKVRSKISKKEINRINIAIHQNDLLNNFNKWLPQHNPNLFSNIDLMAGLEISFSQILDSYHYWNHIFNLYEPRAIFTVCYYTPQNLGLIWASNFHQIPVLEIQHGNQINYPPYFFSKGYNFNSLPSHFLTWDQDSCSYLQKWVLNTDTKKVFTLGNPWLIYWINVLRNSKYDYLEEIRCKINNRKIILYSAVATDDILPESIIQFIKENQKEYFWLIRTHPRQKITIYDYLTQLKKENVDNIELKKASSLPLPIILINSNIHITSFSSVALEASQFKLKSILYSKEGKDRYSKAENMLCVDLDQFKNQRFMLKLINKNIVEVKNNEKKLNLNPIKSIIEE